MKTENAFYIYTGINSETGTKLGIYRHSACIVDDHNKKSLSHGYKCNCVSPTKCHAIITNYLLAILDTVIAQCGSQSNILSNVKLCQQWSVARL